MKISTILCRLHNLWGLASYGCGLPLPLPLPPGLLLPPAFVPARNLCFLLLGRISRFFIATCWLCASRRSAERRAEGNEGGGVRGKPTRLRRAGHNVVMTDAAIKDNYDSGNRFYFRVYLFCSYRLSSSPPPLLIPTPHGFALLPSAISLIAKTDAMFAPLVVAGPGAGPPAWLPKVVRGLAASAIQRLLFG